MKAPFDTRHDPPVGVAERLREGLQVVTAPNAGPMTFTGTRSYLLGRGTLAVIDPGPDDPAHLAALLAAIDGRPVSHVLVTHAHVDHSPLAARLAARLGAPVCAFGPATAGRSPLMQRLAAGGALGGGEGLDHAFTPDVTLRDGEILQGDGWTLEALHTPGHLSSHLCFAWHEAGALFSGDHVMGWASTMVSPPDGDLRGFLDSLARLERRPERLYYPGHGAPLADAGPVLRYLVAHRRAREGQILAQLQQGPQDVAGLTAALYADVDPRLHPAAARNVLAHLVDLFERGIVDCTGTFSVDARFCLAARSG